MSSRRSWIVLLGFAMCGLGSAWLAGMATRPFHDRPGLPMPAAKRLPVPALAQRVVVVVLSGVGADQLNDPNNPFAFPTLRRLAAEGAHGISSAVVPSGDVPTWVALVDGLLPSQSGIVSDGGNDMVPPPTWRTLVVGSQTALRERRSGGPTIIIRPVAASDRVGEAAAQELPGTPAAVTYVLLDLARRAQYSGTQLWQRLDDQLAQVVAVLDPQRDTLIVTADHGRLPDGQFGGNEAAVIQTPLVLWGAGIRPGATVEVTQIDLAPTVAVLLGAPLPMGSTGQPSFYTLALDPADQARAAVAWLDERVARAAPTSAAVASDLVDAHRALGDGQWEAASQAVVAATTTLRVPAAHNSLGNFYLWSIGLPVVLLGIALPVGRWGRRWARRLVLPLFGAEIYVLAWSLIYFVLAGRGISLSSLYGNLQGSLLTAAAWAVLALVASSLPLPWLADGRGSMRAIQGVTRVVGLLFVLGAIPSAAIALLVAQPLTATTAWSVLLLLLPQLAGIGLGAPFVALFAAAVTDIVDRGR